VVAKELLEAARVRARAFEKEAKALRKEFLDRQERDRQLRLEMERLRREEAEAAERERQAALEAAGEDGGGGPAEEG
jgi:hypothetical protein